jgi:2-haloacid dehalogenase
MKALKDAGIRIVTLTNGTAKNTQGLLTKAGLSGFVDKTITIEEVKHWKPRPEVYLHAAKACGVEVSEIALVAAHAWHTQGAGRAGLTTGWVSRTEKRFAPAMDPPDVKGRTLVEVVRGLISPSPRL